MHPLSSTLVGSVNPPNDPSDENSVKSLEPDCGSVNGWSVQSVLPPNHVPVKQCSPRKPQDTTLMQKFVPESEATAQENQTTRKTFLERVYQVFEGFFSCLGACFSFKKSRAAVSIQSLKEKSATLQTNLSQNTTKLHELYFSISSNLTQAQSSGLSNRVTWTSDPKPPCELKTDTPNSLNDENTVNDLEHIKKYILTSQTLQELETEYQSKQNVVIESLRKRQQKLIKILLEKPNRRRSRNKTSPSPAMKEFNKNYSKAQNLLSSWKRSYQIHKKLLELDTDNLQLKELKKQFKDARQLDNNLQCEIQQNTESLNALQC